MNVSDPIIRRKLSDEVFLRLKRLIVSGELQPGDEMPSERELMERFGVGRPAIREAMVRSGFEEQKMGYASAVSVILFVIVLIIALIQRQLLRRFDV